MEGSQKEPGGGGKGGRPSFLITGEDGYTVKVFEKSLSRLWKISGTNRKQRVEGSFLESYRSHSHLLESYAR